MMKKLIFLVLVLVLVSGTASAELINHWKFDDANGGTTTNDGSTGVAGTVLSEVTHNSTGGASGGYMAFTGTNAGIIDGATAQSRIEVSTSAINNLINDAVSVSYWIRIADSELTGSDRFVAYGAKGAAGSAGGGGGNAPWLGGYSPLRDSTRKATWNPGCDSDDPTANASWSEAYGDRTDWGTDGAFDHWAFTNDSTTGVQKIYLNGTVVSDETGMHALMATEYVEFAIGCSAQGVDQFRYQNAFDLDDFQMYNTALGDADVAWLTSNPGSAIPEPATISLLGLGGLALIRRKRS